jgi:hypothetical protein
MQCLEMYEYRVPCFSRDASEMAICISNAGRSGHGHLDYKAASHHDLRNIVFVAQVAELFTCFTSRRHCATTQISTTSSVTYLPHLGIRDSVTASSGVCTWPQTGQFLIISTLDRGRKARSVWLYSPIILATNNVKADVYVGLGPLREAERHQPQRSERWAGRDSNDN